MIQSVLKAFIFLSLTSPLAHAASGIQCSDLFLNQNGRNLKNLRSLPLSYQEHSDDLRFYILMLMSRGVRFVFTDPKKDIDVDPSRLFTEPVISAPWSEGQFDFSRFQVVLPQKITDLAPRTGAYDLLAHLARMERVYQLQKQGVLFENASLFYKNRVTVTGFQDSRKIKEIQVAGLKHLFDQFGFEKVSFEPSEPALFRMGLVAWGQFARNPMSKLELVFRSHFFERSHSWEAFPSFLEESIFRQGRSPLLPDQETPIH